MNKVAAGFDGRTVSLDSARCDRLTNATFGNGVSSIPEGMFYECENLISISIPDGVKSIGTNAFYGCPRLNNVVFPNSLANIDDAAFAGSGFTNIVIPNSVTTVGEGVFADSSQLTTVTIGKGPTNLGNAMFAFCPKLKLVFFAGNAPAVDTNRVYHPLDPFYLHDNATVYYIPGTTGWSSTFLGLPTVLWNVRFQVSGGFGILMGRFNFNVVGTTNIPVMLETCTNLSSGDWQPLAAFTLKNGVQWYYSDANWTNDRARFYRVRPGVYHVN